ncbi:MAG: serine hydrolase domain-containing protein, partial [Bacteroidota bacterium]
MFYIKIKNNRNLKKYKYFLLISAIYFLFLSNAFSQDNASKIDNYLKSYYDFEPFSGIVLVAKGDTVLLHKAFGLANYELAVPNTKETVFNIASLTKPFTALLVMQFVQQGKIKLNAKITDYLLDYPSKNGGRITIHNLLNHTSGLPHYEVMPDFFYKQGREKYAPREFLKLFWNQDLLFQPGTKFKYSSLGYTILGVILEKVSGKSYQELIIENICKPAGMKNTQVDDQISLVRNRANGYEYSFYGLINSDYRDMTTALASGDLISTTEDLFLFIKALDSDKLLNQKFKEIMLKRYPPGAFYGWFGDDIKSGNTYLRKLYHTGGVNGFRSIISKYNNGLCIVILSNFGFTQREKIESDIFQIVETGKQIYSKIRKPIKLDPSVFRKYSGKYHKDSVLSYKISENEEGLSFEWNESSKSRLIPASETKFYFSGN